MVMAPVVEVEEVVVQVVLALKLTAKREPEPLELEG